MNNLKKIIGIIIIVILVICIICGIILYKINKQNNNEEVVSDDEMTQIYDDVEAEPKEEYQYESLKNPSDFFSVEKCIQDNIDENFIAKEMNILDGDRIVSYAVYGNIANTEKYFILREDIENNTFSIDELEKNYDNINQINLETKNVQEIKNNGNNEFNYINMSEEQICREYYDRFSKLELENTQEAYELLDNEYKNERFPTLNEYKEYVNENKDIIENGVLSKYSVDYKDDYTEYVLVDIYDNTYTLQATSVMKYTIKLDNYTIKVDNYEQDYASLSEEEKVQSNVYIFLQMINTKDYKHAYELLDNTFKSNNFDTLEKFKEYVQNNFFNYNLNNYNKIKIQEEGNYYVYDTEIKESSSSVAEKKKLTVIMQLKEGTDFVMSFSVENV